MRTWRLGVVAGALAATLTIGLASCGDDDEGGAAATPQLDPDRLTLEIQGATVPDFATTALPTVTFRVLDANGSPLDLEAELATTAHPSIGARGGRAPTFTLAMLNEHNDYVSYYSASRDPRAYTYIPDPDVVGTTPAVSEGEVKAAHPPGTVTQATSVAVTRGPNLARVGDRVYRFTFPAPTTPRTSLDRTKTHTVAGWVVRKPNDFDSDIGRGSFNFVPAGGTAQRLETITDQGCNRCHGELTAHGTRRGVQFCITCHSPQTSDPETGETVDFKVMIHRIHSGRDLPSVKQEGPAAPYFIVGNSQTVHDWSDVSFPWHDHGVQHCTVCHTGEDANNWRTRPSFNACTSCHDNVKFAAAEAAGLPDCSSDRAGTPIIADDCAHPVLMTVTNRSDVASCQGCHGDGNVNEVDRYHHGD